MTQPVDDDPAYADDVAQEDDVADVNLPGVHMGTVPTDEGDAGAEGVSSK